MIDTDGDDNVRNMELRGTQYGMVKVIDATQSFDNSLGSI